MTKKKTTKKARPVSSKKRSPAKKRGKSSRIKKRSIFKSLVKWLFVLGLWGGLFMVGLFAWYAGELPDITKQATFERKTSITINAYDGSLITRYGELHGNSLSVEDMPPHLIYAVIATEDRRFYSHFGIDLLGLARAMVVNVQKGRFAQGGSTITQQLAKNLFLSRDRKIKRKIQEAMLAIWLERELSKDEIMSAYLNRVYLGAGAYGVDAAAQLYFNKPVKDINVREAAIIAGLLKAPSRYSPLHNPALAKQRSDVVLQAMVDAGYLNETDAKTLTDVPPKPAMKRREANAGRYYTDWIVDGLDDLIGTPAEDIIVQTTLNPRIQKIAENALTKTIDQVGVERGISQGAVVVMRPDGAVVGMVGGVDYTKSEFNRAEQARRQPGSAFKPVLYLTALENGWKPDDMILDAPITEGSYRPKNFGDKYMGEVTLATALKFSLNTVAYRLIKSVGIRAVKDTAKRLGIISPLRADMSLALGSSGVSPIELATAYATIANGGFAVYPFAITKITAENGELYYQRPDRRVTRRVVERKHAQDLALMMQGVIEEGTGRRAKLPFPASGKTGTSQDSRDAWFSGFSTELVTTVWLGNDDNTPMNGVTGGSNPAAIWQEVMSGSRGQYNAISNADFNSSTFDGLLGRLLSGGNRAQTDDKKPRYND